MCLSCSRKEKSLLYLFRQLSVMMIFTGQSTYRQNERERDYENIASETEEMNTVGVSDLVAELETVQRVWRVRMEDLREVSQRKREVDRQLTVAVNAVL